MGSRGRAISHESERAVLHGCPHWTRSFPCGKQVGMTPDSLDLHLADVNTFLVVQRLGSVTASARQLGVTPAQVSKAVARLEAQLGSKLFTRSARGVAL